MVNFDIIYQETLKKYFNLLEKTGSTSKPTLKQILVLKIVQKLCDEYYEYMTDEDLIFMTNLIDRFQKNNCLIDFNTCLKSNLAVNKLSDGNIVVRVSKNNAIRSTESYQLRVPSTKTECLEQS